MRIIARSTLTAFWESNQSFADAKEHTLAWYRHALHADWASPPDVKRDFATASILKDGRVVFNIAGNKYRLVVEMQYRAGIVWVKFVGTHAQYYRIDVENVNDY